MICAVCGQPKTKDITIDGTTVTVGVACDCDRQRYDAMMSRVTTPDVSVIGLPAMYKDAYSDGESTARMIEAVKSGHGLVVAGPVGTGKTFTAASIARSIAGDGRRVVGIHAADTTAVDFDVSETDRYDLLVIDDIGAERQTDFGQERICSLVDHRVGTGKPMVITTNLTPKAIADARDGASGVQAQRIWDRILSVCAVTVMMGQSRRRAQADAVTAAVREVRA